MCFGNFLPMSTLRDAFFFFFFFFFLLQPKTHYQQKQNKPVRQSHIVQSFMQDCKYVSSYLLPVCDLLVQGPKITYDYCLSRKAVLNFIVVFCIEFRSF